MSPRVWIVLGGLLAASGLGWALTTRMGWRRALARNRAGCEPDAGVMGKFETAVRNQLYHALALVVVGIVACRRLCVVQSDRWADFFGRHRFRGTLYYSRAARGCTSIPGSIVPSGGLGMDCGWMLVRRVAGGLISDVATKEGPARSCTSVATHAGRGGGSIRRG